MQSTTMCELGRHSQDVCTLKRENISHWNRKKDVICVMRENFSLQTIFADIDEQDKEEKATERAS